MDIPELRTVYYHNTVQEYLVALGTFILVAGAFLIVRRAVVGRLKWLAEKTETKIDDLFVELLEMIRTPECYLIAFYVASRPLILPVWADRGFRAVIIISITFRIARMLQRVAAFSTTEWLLKNTQQDSGYYHTQTAVSYLTNALIWSLAVIFALDNMGFSVSSIIAGLGIGGVAVALAAQAVLGDLFAAIAIYLDRPFLVGDAITFNDATGVVERIGFKTTHLKAISGERLVVPNSQLAGARIQNWRHQHDRRVVLAFSAAYGTPWQKLNGLPEQLKAIIAQAGGDKVKVDRVHLKSLGASSIDFECVYIVKAPDYALHMDIQQRVNLLVLEHFEREGIDIPFPTQTIQLAKAPA